MPVVESVARISASAATSAIGDKLIGSVLDEIEETIDQIAQNTSIIFTNVMEDLISQMQTSFQEVWREVSDDLNKLVQDVAEQVRVQIYSLSLAAERLIHMVSDELENVTDEAIRELRQTLSRTVIYSEDFALDEIDGTLILSDVSSDWGLRVTGLNVGFDSEDIQSILTLIIKQPSGPKLKIPGAELSASEVEFIIPIEFIEEHRTDFTITTLDAELDILIKKDRFLFFDKKFKKVQPLKITIAPRISGEIFAAATVARFDWVQRAELNRDYSIGLPSGHHSSSSKVVMHRLHHSRSIPRASVPPKPNETRFRRASYTGCSGGGCSHVWKSDVSVVNNGSQLNMYTENNSHAVSVTFRGHVERFEQVSEHVSDEQHVPIKHGSVIECRFDASASKFRFTGKDMDFGFIDLVVEKDPTSTTYPMPSGEFGGLVFLGTERDGAQVIYRFSRRTPR
jgi:gas vesicle protein